MVVGAAVLFFKNDLQPAGLFRNYWDATLKSNSTYYPNIGNVESEES